MKPTGRPTSPKVLILAALSGAAGVLALAAPPAAAGDDVWLTFAGSGTTGTATANFTAKRTGRRVVLQVKEPAGDWARVGQPKEQTRSPLLKFHLANLRHEAFAYRVVVGKWKGAPGYVSAETEWAPDPYVPKKFGSPVIQITTLDHAPITSKEDYVNGTGRLEGVDMPLKIRGRGNSTWLLPKKPYKLKLDTASSLLGMPADRDWSLIANFGDHSLARNATALGLSPKTTIPWSPRFGFVEVILNGEYEGSYQLTEHIKAAPDRVDLPEGDLLLEIDERGLADGDPGVRTAHGFPIVYQDPDDPSPETQAAFETFIANFETALYGPDFADPEDGYAAYVDLDTLVDWYLVNELFKNVDSDLYSSCWFTWDGEKISMGPLWDFDVSSGFPIPFWPGYSDPQGWWTRGSEIPFDPRTNGHHNTHWIARMFEDPAFEDLVAARWDELKPAFEKSEAKPVKLLDKLGVAASNDRERWAGAQYYPDWAHGMNPEAEAKFLSRWLRDRIAWIDETLNPE